MWLTLWIVSITTYGANFRLLCIIFSCRCVRYGSVEESIAVLASGIVHHDSAQAGCSRLCKREPTSSYCNTEADQVSYSCLQSIGFVLGLATGSISILPSGKGRYRFEVEFWLQFHIFWVRGVPRIWRKLSATCAPLSAITTVAVNTSTVIITNSFVVVSTHPAALASKVLRNGNHSKLCPYISVRSN